MRGDARAGTLLAREKFCETTLRVDGEGSVITAYAGFATPSPDRRYLLRVEQDGRDRVATLPEVATGREESIRLPACPRGSRDGRLMLVHVDE